MSGPRFRCYNKDLNKTEEESKGKTHKTIVQLLQHTSLVELRPVQRQDGSDDTQVWLIAEAMEVGTVGGGRTNWAD